MPLSKSNYLLYLKHPAWLWLEKHDKTKLPKIDADLQAVFDAGNLFESYAEKLFPDGMTLGYKTNDQFDWNKYQALPEVTQQAIADNAKVIFQGRLEVDDITCIFDVLERNEDGTHNLSEIKSSTKAKKEHAYDLAFQVTVLERSGLSIKDVFVIHVNNEYVHTGDIKIENITATTKVTDAVRSIMDETQVNIAKAKETMLLGEMPDPSPRYAGMEALGEWLDIYKSLNPELATYSIYNLYSPGASRLGQLEDENIGSIGDIPDNAQLSTKQQYQVKATKKGERLINKEKIREFLQTFTFPLYFFDYETLAGVIPAYDGLRPYQQTPFQYSLHKLESPGAELEHTEYLHTDNTLPVASLLKQLKADIGTTGSVVVWYQNFEKGRNEEMAALVPEYSAFLKQLNDRIIDLMIPFAEGWYVDKDFLGSASIKMVLPVLIPQLSYKDLTISGGNSAQRIWMETVIDGKNKDNKEQIMDDLRKYCTLDTFAMVEIWKILKKVK